MRRDRRRRTRERRRHDHHQRAGHRALRRQVAKPQPADQQREHRISHVQHAETRYRHGVERGDEADPAEANRNSGDEAPGDRSEQRGRHPQQHRQQHQRRYTVTVERDRVTRYAGVGQRFGEIRDRAETHAGEQDQAGRQQGAAVGGETRRESGHGAIAPWAMTLQA